MAGTHIVYQGIMFTQILTKSLLKNGNYPINQLECPFEQQNLVTPILICFFVKASNYLKKRRSHGLFVSKAKAETVLSYGKTDHSQDAEN